MNLELIDRELERAEDLKHLKRILADPYMAQLAEKVLLSQNGSSNGITRQDPENNSGSEADAVRRSIATMEGALTVGVVADRVRKYGRDIENLAVSRVMKQMANRGELGITQRRFGSLGNIYEKGESFRDVK